MIATRKFDIEDIRAFAELSGDCNPIHVDPVAARRTIFGAAAAHGMLLVLWALDAIVSPDRPARILAVRAQFLRPILANQIAILQAQGNGRDYVVEGPHGLAAQIKVEFGPETGKDENRDWPREGPILGPCRDNDANQLAGLSGELPLSFDVAALSAQFPRASKSLPVDQLAALLATTRLVGMECPGLHSVFQKFRLAFDAEGPRRSLSWAVENVFGRHGPIGIKVSGGGLGGHLTAFVRPNPVTQPSIAALADLLPRDFCIGRRALVVGGSRGLGELTAKLIAAAGGQVLLTYNVGQGEARQIEAEANVTPGQIAVRHLDILSSKDDIAASIGDFQPDQVYLFASPHIEFSDGSFDLARFGRYVEFYVAGLDKVARAVAPSKHDARRVRLFVPSTIFLDRPEIGAAEYSAAKSASEALARSLPMVLPGFDVLIRRLPRLPTDQTATIAETPLEDALPHVVEFVRSMNAK